MKYLVMIIMLFTLVMVVRADGPERTVVYNGVTIVLPDDADLCVYDNYRCVWGFTVTGRFPGLEMRDAILGQLQGNGLVLDYPLCEEGLVVSPAIATYPCYLRIDVPPTD